MSNNNLSWLEINRDALLHNVAEFRKIISPGVKIMAVVKAEAYGHGLKEVEEVIGQSVDWFGVNNLDEAIKLKDLGVKSPILILGYTPFSRFDEVVANDFRQVIYSRESIKFLFKCFGKTKNKKVRIHLKVETGTNRQGIGQEEISDFVKLVKAHPGIEIEGIYTHFANVEDNQNLEYAQKQFSTFKDTISLLAKSGFYFPLKHAASTAAALIFPESRLDMIRLGIGFYGLWPSGEVRVSAKRLGINLNLEPALTWKTKVIQVKKVKRGERVGYGCTFTAPRDLKIAVLPVGYFDGYDRKLSNRGEVLIGGKRARVVGRVCMNMFMVDVTDMPKVKVEGEVVLLGRQGENRISAEELAEKVGTINYEIVSRINPQVSRVVV